MSDETGTLSPRVLLRCSGCGLRWTAATLDPAACPACGRRAGIALVRRFGAGTMSLHAGPSPALVESPPRSGTPTPDHERPPWHVTDVTPASDAAPPEDPGGTVQPGHPTRTRSSLADKRHNAV